MAKKRTIHSANFKAKVALGAAKGMKTTTQLASEYGVATGQISNWMDMVAPIVKTEFIQN